MKKKIKITLCSLIILTFPSVIYADDVSWQINNSRILENNGIVSSALRSVGWGILKLLTALADICEGLYNKTFGMVDLTNYAALNAQIERLKPVLVAVTCLCLVGLGITYMVKQEKIPIVRNILIGILAVSCSTYAFATANSLVASFKEAMLQDQHPNQAYAIVNNNTVDLVGVDKSGNITALNYNTGSGVVHNAGINSRQDMDGVKINEVLNWSDKKEGQELYKWSNQFNDLIKYKAVKLGDTYGKAEVYNGLLTTTIGNEFYYRYSFDFWSIFLELVSIVLVFLALSYKNVRIAYELMVGRVLAFMYAGDVGNGERLKTILIYIRDIYITLCVSVFCIKLYEILTEAITTIGITGLAKGIVAIFIAFAVIDGPNIVERLLGIDAGLSSSIGRTMAIFGMARTGGRLAKKVAGGTKDMGMAVATGKGRAERLSDRHGASRKEQVGIGLHNALTKKNKNASGSSSSNTETGGSTPGTGAGSSQEGNGSSGAGSTESNAKTTGAYNESSTEETGSGEGFRPNAEGAGQNSFDTDFMNSNTQDKAGSNPRLKDTIRRLTPDKNSSVGERRDFHRQVDNIIKGNHEPIKPPENDRTSYKFNNYLKAVEIAKVYKEHGQSKDVGQKIEQKENKDGK